MGLYLIVKSLSEIENSSKMWNDHSLWDWDKDIGCSVTSSYVLTTMHFPAALGGELQYVSHFTIYNFIFFNIIDPHSFACLLENHIYPALQFPSRSSRMLSIILTRNPSFLLFLSFSIEFPDKMVSDS